MPDNPGSKYEVIMRKVISDIQVMIYRRESAPIRDWNEVKTDLLLRITELDHSTGEKRQRNMIELAAYAIFAVAADQSDSEAHG